ncbi:Chlorophyll A-B binding protein [Dillenia turbinata]|uniref:Chlorophyll A-B binding protein n=1 Tax=Dillenia turbinata TaxID=194707 RepID=A0AAN8UJN2_9MAGN
MATSAALLLANPMATRLSTQRGSPLILPSSHLPRMHRSVDLRVKSMAADQEERKGQASSPSSSLSPEPTPSPPPKPKVSTKFSDVLAFSGPAPERINGRLAMIGFVAAMAVELTNGQDVFTQISEGGIPWFLGTSVVLSVASLIPLFKGVTVQSKSEGLMNSDAELWNGRLAMLGLVALAFTEFVKGGALV